MDADFNDDGLYDVADIDLLVAAIAAGSDPIDFDLTGDGLVDLADRDAWLAAAGAINLPSGNPYLLGDANLDGSVDGSDFGVWNAHKFNSPAAWSHGDFNADGIVDGLDFIEWNMNKFQSSDVPNELVFPKSSRSPHLTHEAGDVRIDENTTAVATRQVTRLTPLTAKRVGSLFAMSHRGEVHKVESPKVNSFDNLGDALFVNSWGS